MRVFVTFMSYLRRHRTLVLVGLIFGAAYFSSWSLRRELGLAHPAANLRYFYFGTAPGTLSDRALYWFYYPAYRPYLTYQEACYGERYDVHWHDRRDPPPAELGMTDAEFQ